MHRLTGINLHPGKEELVNARLTKRLRALGLKSFDAYLEYLKRVNPEGELVALIEAMTTNKTSFFREQQHFDYLGRQIVAGAKKPEDPSLECRLLLLAKNPTLLPSCSTKRPKISPCGTSVSWQRISQPDARTRRKGTYDTNHLQDVPPLLISKYFTCIETKPVRSYQVINHYAAWCTLPG